MLHYLNVTNKTCGKVHNINIIYFSTTTIQVEFFNNQTKILTARFCCYTEKS